MSAGVRQRVLLAGAVVVLGAAATIYVLYGREERVAASFTIDAVCLRCSHEAQLQHPPAERAPFKCPACGEQAAYGWWYCYDCQMRFVPRPMPVAGELPRTPAMPSCAKCGSRRTGEYVKEAPDQQPVGDLELPKMP